MEEVAIKAYTEQVQRLLFDRIGLAVGEAQDLGGFENFVYSYGSRVVRITHESHRSRAQLRGELEFVRYLSEGSDAVAAPISFSAGEDVITEGEFHVCQFEKASGNTPTIDEPFSQAVITRWGSCIGRFHRLARDFHAKEFRQDWRADENHQFAERIPASEARVLDRAAELMDSLNRLEQNSETYGLIHSDAHAGNFLNDNGRLTFFDFDDCLYTWYGYDVATILVGVALQRWVENDDTARLQAVREFLPVFLEGYSKENDTGCLAWASMHEFLKLRELSLYAVIHAQLDAKNPDGWMPQKFMWHRKERIEQGSPYIEIDFSPY